jgi:hypothetical protein
MKAYFQLQYRMINRQLSDSGINPVIGYLLVLIIFLGLSLLLFHQTTFAEYIYVLFPLYISLNLPESKRNDFLKICFGDKRYKIIRIIENLTIAFPFIVFLLYKHCFTTSLILLFFSLLTGATTTKTSFSWVIPTPFAKNPFEFTVGFRNTFYLFMIAYCLTGIAIVVGNFNLGAFALILVLLVTWSYYVKPENKYYVWLFSLSPKSFLFYKIKIAFYYSFLLCLPVLLSLSIFYWEHTGILLLCFGLGYTFLVLLILAKYAAFPEEMNVKEVILVVLCLSFPPLLIAVIPYFLPQSVKSLHKILK